MESPKTSGKEKTSIVNNVNLSLIQSASAVTSPQYFQSTLNWDWASGVNTTGPLEQNQSSLLPDVADVAFYGLTLLAISDPLTGVIVGTSALAYSLLTATDGHSTLMVGKSTGQNALTYEHLATVGGSIHYHIGFENVYGTGIPFTLKIPASMVNSTVKYSFSAANVMGVNYDLGGYENTGYGAVASSTYEAVPAVEIGGTLYLGHGNQYPAAHHYVYLV